MFRFLREIIAIQSFDMNEGAVLQRIEQEMRSIGFDHIEKDSMGNLLGYIGHGKHLIAMDGHVDTVSFGDIANWTFDPFEGMEDEDTIGGLGSSDQKGGVAAMIFAARVIKELKMEDDYTLLVVCSVQEEDCDGRCWQYIIEEDGIRPEFVLLTEPTDGIAHNGQKGRMTIRIKIPGESCHGSMPEKGVNAIYKTAPVIKAIEELNKNMTDDNVLGKGSVTISQISSTAPSLCAVADSCTIMLDRRLNMNETPDLAIEQLKKLPEIQESGAEVSVLLFDDPSYTGLEFPVEVGFPAWILDRSSDVCSAFVDTYERLFGENVEIKPFFGSTNGVAIMGKHHIPCIIFGPGHGDQAHRPNERTWKEDIVKSCAVYAALPGIYVEKCQSKKEIDVRNADI